MSGPRLLEQLILKLQSREPVDFSSRHVSHACVALLLRGATLDSLEVAYIRRSIAETDRWSGHVGFPGGRADPVDSSDLETARREVLEEVGIELSPSALVGRIDDLRARNRDGWLDFYIRPFVFFLERDPEIRLDPREVADFFWIPLAELGHPSRETLVTIEAAGGPAQYPAIQVQGDPPLWGLTLLMTQDLLLRLASL